MSYIKTQFCNKIDNNPVSRRWILLCFKREFPEADTLRMWEACWAHYQTDYFHLFIAVALIAVYGEDIVQQDLPADETLLHFSSLSMHMNVHVILKKVGNVCLRSRNVSSVWMFVLCFNMVCGSILQSRNIGLFTWFSVRREAFFSVLGNLNVSVILNKVETFFLQSKNTWMWFLWWFMALLYSLETL